MREGGATDTPVDCASVTTELAPPRRGGRWVGYSSGGSPATTRGGN